MKEFMRESKFASAMESGKRYYVQSPFRFRKAGKSGIEICKNFTHRAECVDDLCIYKNLDLMAELNRLHQQKAVIKEILA